MNSPRTLRIGCGAGFLGDQLDAPRQLVESSELDFLMLEHLAELTLSILAQQRRKNPEHGYARDFLEILESLSPALRRQSQLRIVTNSGGMNPLACARAAAEVLEKQGLGDCVIGVVTGDDLLERQNELAPHIRHFETGQTLAEAKLPFVSINAYQGAEGIKQALDAGARIVITGRVADASLTVGPAAHHFGWNLDDIPRIAGASVAGHLIECGAQVTGGYSTRERYFSLTNIGYPIAEIAGDGSCVITKPDGTDGIVDRISVTEQLVYEIGDPTEYFTPDVVCDFTSVELEDLGSDRVAVRGASGTARPQKLKVSLAYQNGYMMAGELLVAGRTSVIRALDAETTIIDRAKNVGALPERYATEVLGIGMPRRFQSFKFTLENMPPEVVLRIAAADPDRKKLERFAREFAPLITSSAAGIAGYAAGRPQVREVLAYWPALIDREHLTSSARVQTALEWLQ